MSVFYPEMSKADQARIKRECADLFQDAVSDPVVHAAVLECAANLTAFIVAEPSNGSSVEKATAIFEGAVRKCLAHNGQGRSHHA